MITKHYKQKVSNNNQGGGATVPNKIKTEDKELIDMNKSIDWKKEREYLFTKIKTLEKEVNSLKTKNQELQIQLTLTQTSIESKKSFVVTDENIKEPQKRRVDHKRIYSEMFTSYRKKKLKQNSDDARSGIGVLKQLIKQKPKSFGEGSKEIIGNKILSNIIKEFRKDLKDQKKLGQINNNGNGNNTTLNKNKILNKNLNKNNTLSININLNNAHNNNTINSNHNTVLNKDNNKIQYQKISTENKFIKNLTNKVNINNYAHKKSFNNNNINNNNVNKCFSKKNTNNNIIINTNSNNGCNNLNRKRIGYDTMNNTQNGSLADDSHQNGMNNKTYNQPRVEINLNNDLSGNYYEFHNSKRIIKNNLYNEIDPLNNLNSLNLNNNEIINNIDNDDFMEKINESSSGQTHRTGETIIKKPNDFNSNINTSISNSLSNSYMKKSNSNNNTNNNSNNSKNEIVSNLNNIKNITPPPTISQSSSVIYQPYTKIEGFSSSNSLSSKRSGGRNGPASVLKFHLDSVRGIYIDPFQKVLTSVSEDKTMALWDLEKILKHPKDEEPYLVFRIHTTPIFTVTGASNKNIVGDYLNNVSVYSSGSDGVIRGIKIPSVNTPNSEENMNKHTLLSWRVHQDMIWQLNYHPSNFLLSSVSSDGTVKIFKTYELYEEKNNFDENKFRKSKTKKINIHHYYHYDNSYSKNLVRNLIFRNRRDNIIEIPTSCDWRPEISSQIIVSHIAPYIRLYDIETGQNVNDFSFDVERNIQYESKQVNKIVFFNNDLFVTGHEDKHVKFFDINSNKVITDFVAHTDSINDLCKGFNEYQLLTCSQDGSVRSWDLRGGKNKLIFDILAHRKKYDEGCFAIKTFQLRGENYFVTCGADGCIKIFSSFNIN